MPAKRKNKVMVAFRLNAESLAQLSRMSKKRGQTRTRIIEDAILRYAGMKEVTP